MIDWDPGNLCLWYSALPLLMIGVFACNWILYGSCPLGMRNVGRAQKSHPVEERWANGAILSADRIWTGSVYTSLTWLCWECKANKRQDYKNPLDHYYLHKHISNTSTHFYSCIRMALLYPEEDFYYSQAHSSADLMEFSVTHHLSINFVSDDSPKIPLDEIK